MPITLKLSPNKQNQLLIFFGKLMLLKLIYHLKDCQIFLVGQNISPLVNFTNFHFRIELLHFDFFVLNFCSLHRQLQSQPHRHLLQKGKCGVRPARFKPRERGLRYANTPRQLLLRKSFLDSRSNKRLEYDKFKLKLFMRLSECGVPHHLHLKLFMCYHFHKDEYNIYVIVIQVPL